MKIKFYFLVYFINICCIFSQEQKMTELEIAVFKQEVGVFARNIKTLSSDFIQYKHLDFLEKDIETKGIIIFKEPNILLWEYRAPYKYKIIFRDKKIFINDGSKKSTVDIEKNVFFGKINKLIIESVKGNMFDDKEFLISYFRLNDQNLVKFIPKDTSLKRYIKQIELTFGKEEAAVIEIKLIESSKDFIRIVFKNKLFNTKIEDAVFSN